MHGDAHVRLEHGPSRGKEKGGRGRLCSDPTRPLRSPNGADASRGRQSRFWDSSFEKSVVTLLDIKSMKVGSTHLRQRTVVQQSGLMSINFGAAPLTSCQKRAAVELSRTLHQERVSGLYSGRTRPSAAWFALGMTGLGTSTTAKCGFLTGIRPRMRFFMCSNERARSRASVGRFRHENGPREGRKSRFFLIVHGNSLRGRDCL